MTARLRVVLLGGIDVMLDGVPLTDFGSKKSPALLSYLMTTGRPHSREALSGLLWGDSGDSKARASLRTTLWDLRQHLPEFLTTDRTAVSFNQEAPYWLDVEAFRTSLEKVLGSAPGDRDRETSLTAEEVALLEKGLALYQGDFLAGFYVSEAPAFEGWVLRTREWTRQLATHGWHRLVVHHTAQKAYVRGIDAATELLKIAPWQEESHRRLMRLLALDGQRGAALAQYEACRDMLEDQLGVEPTVETRLLYSRIKSGQAVDRSEHRAASDATVQVGCDSYSPPVDQRSLVGRDSDLLRLQELLSSSESRLTALVGRSGAGKTRLAWEAAQQMAEEFEHGAWLIRTGQAQRGILSRRSTGGGGSVGRPGDEDGRWADMILPIVRALGLSLTGGTALAVQLADYLCHREMLLILDDLQLEHGDIELLHRLIRGAPLVRVLVVAEASLETESVETLHLDGLETPPPPTDAAIQGEELEELTKEGAVALFQGEAKRAAPEFRLDRHTADGVVRLCQLAEGLPLDIEMLAATLAWAPLREAVRRLERREKRASAQRRIEQQSSPVARVSLTYAWDVLRSDQQVLLSWLMIFADDFDEEAARKVVEADRAELEELADRAWLDRVGPDRYVMHPGARAFVRSNTRELASGADGEDRRVDAAGVRDRYKRHYLSLVATRQERLVGSGAKTACAGIQRDWRGIRNAWTQAVDDGEVELLEGALEGLTRFLLLAGWYSEGENLLDSTFTSLRGCTGDVASPWFLGRLLTHRARLLNEQRRGGAASRATQAALDLVGEPDRLEAAALQMACGALVEWGRALYLQGELKPATERLKEALTVAGDDGHNTVRATAFRCLGMVSARNENYEEARVYLERALSLYDLSDQQLDAASVRADLGMVAVRQRRYTPAESYLMEALSMAQSMGNRRGESVAYMRLGCLAAAQGDHDGAADRCERALRIARDLGDRCAEAEALVELGAASLHQGDTGRAWKRSILAVESAHAVGDTAGEARAWLVAGHVFSELGMLDQAARACRAALELQPGSGEWRLTAESLACMARIRLARDDLPGAQGFVEQILGQLEAHPLPGGSEALRVYLTCYEVLKGIDDPRADDVLNRVSSLYQERDSIASVRGFSDAGSEGGATDESP